MGNKLVAPLVVLLVMLLGPDLALGQQVVKVTKLRTDKVALYDGPNGTKVGEVTKDQFKEPWIVAGELKEGFLPVHVAGARVWVKAFAVDTDKAIVANAECGAVVASRQPKGAVTRGLGEECQKK